MNTPSATLWRNRNFAGLWAGQTISLFGSNITQLAIPLAAVTQLAATPIQMGVLQMVQYLPFLLFGLLAGVWVDRLPRRSALMATDIGRAVALGCIPLAALGGWLQIELLYVVAFVVGTLNLVFEAAYAAFLPQIVPAEQLALGNSRMQVSASIAEIAGPGLAGWLVQLVGAAFAIVGDAVSFLISLLMLALMRVEEAVPAARERQPLLRELREGLARVLGDPYLRPLAFCSATANLFINMHLAIYVLFLTRALGFTPAQIGLLYAAGSVGGLAGALGVNQISRRLGLGRAITGETIAVGLACVALPLLSLRGPQALPLMALMHAVWGFWTPIYVVNAASLRQLTTPSQLLGRVTASTRFISWGMAAIGFLIGGAVAEYAGLLPTLIIAGVGLLLSSLWIILSRVRTLTDMPNIGEAGAVALAG